MAQASLLTQLLGDPALTAGTKKGGFSFAGLLGDTVPAGNSVQDFQNLLASVLKGNKTGMDTAALTAAKTATLAGQQSADITLEDVLKGLPPEIAALLRAQAALEATTLVPGQPATEGQDVLNILSAATQGDTKINLVTIVSDPELVATLQSITTQIKALKGDIDLNAFLAGDLQATDLSPTLLKAAEKLVTQLETLQGKTITIADLDADGFQALKKIAFADIAPFLSRPRNVVVDGRTVMKIAQGPAFLNDEGTDLTMLVLNSGLVPAIPAEAVNTTNPLLMGLNTTPVIAPEGTVNNPVAAATAASTQGAAQIAAAPIMAPVINAPKSTGKSAATSTPAAATNNEFTPTSGTQTQTAAPATAPVTGATVAKTQVPVQATPATTAPATNSDSRGFGITLENLTGSLSDTLTVSADDGMQPGFKIQADLTQPGNSTAQMIASRSAGQPHPAMHLVSVSVQRNLDPRSAGMERTFTIQMDPANLGRVRVTLQFGENNTVKAKLMAERPETLSLLQKDAGALERMLNSNGLDTSDAGSISFGLSEGDSFSGSMQDPSGQSHAKNKSASDDAFGTENAAIENVMPIFVDPATGLTHVNVVI